MNILYQTTQILYWLTLSVWLGGMMFLAAGAPLVFRVAKRMDVRLPRYSEPSLTDEQSTILAGEIVGALLARMGQMQMVCASVLLPLILAQFLTVDLYGANRVAAVLRLVLWAGATLLVAYEWRSHYPRVWKLRQEYLEHAAEPEVAGPVRERFEREQNRSGMLFQITVFLLIGMVMFSANISPKAKTPAATSVPAAPAR